VCGVRRVKVRDLVLRVGLVLRVELVFRVERYNRVELVSFHLLRLAPLATASLRFA
jgi:hypothetical protein